MINFGEIKDGSSFGFHEVGSCPSPLCSAWHFILSYWQSDLCMMFLFHKVCVGILIYPS